MTTKWILGGATRPKIEVAGARLVEECQQPGTPFTARYVYDERGDSAYWHYTDDPREPMAVSCWPVGRGAQ